MQKKNEQKKNSLLGINSYNADDIPTVISTIRVNIEFVFKSKIFTHSKMPRIITDKMSNTTNKIPILPKLIIRSEERVICRTKPHMVAKKANNPTVICAFVSWFMSSCQQFFLYKTF